MLYYHPYDTVVLYYHPCDKLVWWYLGSLQSMCSTIYTLQCSHFFGDESLEHERPDLFLFRPIFLWCSIVDVRVCCSKICSDGESLWHFLKYACFFLFLLSPHPPDFPGQTLRRARKVETPRPPAGKRKRARARMLRPRRSWGGMM